MSKGAIAARYATMDQIRGNMSHPDAIQEAKELLRAAEKRLENVDRAHTGPSSHSNIRHIRNLQNARNEVHAAAQLVAHLSPSQANHSPATHSQASHSQASHSQANHRQATPKKAKKSSKRSTAKKIPINNQNAAFQLQLSEIKKMKVAELHAALAEVGLDEEGAKKPELVALYFSYLTALQFE